jgi:magnesium chelatase subunit D
MMALRHRLRRDPLEQSGGSSRIEQRLDKLFPSAQPGQEIAEAQGKSKPHQPSTSTQKGIAGDNGRAGELAGEDPEGMSNGGISRSAPPSPGARLPDDASDLKLLTHPKQLSGKPSRRRSAASRQTSESALHGRYIRSTRIKTPGARIALDATLRAVGSGQWAVGRKRKAEGRKRSEAANESKTANCSSLPTAHCPLSTALRYKRFKQKAGTLFIFAIDTSGSMALNRIAQAKGALVRLLEQSYVRRDRVALLCFRGQAAEVLLPPSASIWRARRLLDELSVGGATPLGAGLARSLELAERARRQGTERIVLLLFTDGRANVSLRKVGAENRGAGRRLIEEELEVLGQAARQASLTTIVVDAENRFTSSGEGQKLADQIGARYLRLGSAVDKVS